MLVKEGDTMANDDKIYQAYIGEMGSEFQHQTKMRIDWILDNAKASKTILDIGCSQGIVSILLAKVGARVIGIDIQKENILFAQELLCKDYSELQNSITFDCVDFLKYEYSGKFDGIIITEVLEHVEAPELFLQKATALLSETGRLIITLPFGVNDHPDHKETYYLYNTYQLVAPILDIVDIQMQDGWIGIIACCKGSLSEVVSLNETLFQSAEQAFYHIDRSLNNRLKSLYSKNLEANEKYRKMSELINNYKADISQQKVKISNLSEQITTWKDWHKSLQDKYEALQVKNNGLQASHADLQTKYIDLQAERTALKTKYIDLQAERTALQTQCDDLDNLLKELKKDYFVTASDGIQLLSSVKEQLSTLQMQNGYLTRENAEYRRKFAKITETLPGRVALWGYRWLKRVKNRLYKLFH
ncbi:MAG: methyltransferase domain-containing protein [Christensenellaceae bacterium]